MKQVWILNHYAQEPEGAGGTRHFHLAEHLRDFGWQAVIIAASVEHKTGHQRLERGETRRLEQKSGVPYLWVRTTKHKANGVARMVNMLAYMFRTLSPRTTALLPRPDVVIGSSVHPFAAFAGMLLARRFKVPFVFEVRDLWPQTLVDMGRLRERSLMTKALRKLELSLYRRAARIVVLLPNAWEYITPLGIPKERVTWIPNGVDLTLFQRSNHNAFKKSDIDNISIMYFGAHGQANDLNNVLQAMRLVQEMPEGQRIQLRLIGDGPLKPALIELSAELKLKNVSFEPSVVKTQIPMLASQADVFIISVLDLPNLYRYGISMNKLFDYLAAGRPIIIASNAVNNPVVDAHAGLTVDAGKPEALADAILQMAVTSLEERQRMGLAGRDYVEQNHGFQQLAGRLANVLDEVCSKNV